MAKDGIHFLGFRNFYYHRILKKNKRKFINNKIKISINEYKETNDYEKLMQIIESILSHIENADTFNLRKNIVAKFTKDL